jgi:two-component system sensor histidine kinase PilS (NtrC family)
VEQRTLASVSPDLAKRLDQWRARSMAPHSTLVGAEGSELLPRFLCIGEHCAAGFLIFLDDASDAAQHAQQLKLAGLGRLTASIAHEVRNPLGAISHAGELLGESEHLDKSDRRLIEIITQQVQRVNGVIESVLQLGRREGAQWLALELESWLERFAAEFVQTSAVNRESIGWQVQPATLRVRFDPNHLHQILWNLCQNGLHHARNGAGGAKVMLSAGVEGGRAYLDVTDNGPGVPPEVRPHLFEPFFTTERTGNGLGLYISRELALCNRARLDYLPSAEHPGRFRISFGLPELPADGT